MSEEYIYASIVQREKLRAFRKLLTVVKAVCLILMIAMDVLFIAKGYLGVGCITIGLTLLLVFSRSCDRFILLRRRKKSPFWNQDVRIELDEDGFRQSSELSNSSLRWGAFTKGIGVKDGFLIFQGPHGHVWLPLTAFRDEPRREAVAELLKASLTKYDEA